MIKKIYTIFLLFFIITSCCKKPIYSNTTIIDTVKIKPDTLYFADTIKLKSDTVTLIFNPCDSDLLYKSYVLNKRKGKVNLTVTSNKGELIIDCNTDSLIYIIDSLKTEIVYKEIIIKKSVETITELKKERYIPLWVKLVLGSLAITTSYFILKQIIK